MTNANEIELLAKANRYTIGKDIEDRLFKLISKENLSLGDKIRLAINYAHSITKSEMRGTR
jgi:hypothetical protein